MENGPDLQAGEDRTTNSNWMDARDAIGKWALGQHKVNSVRYRVVCK